MFAYPPAPPAINSFGGEVNDADEVRRARVDPCGSLTFFISKKENRVYVKYIDLSGLPVIEVYEKAKGTEGYRNTCSIVEAIKEDGEKTRAMFSAYQMAELKAKLEERDRQLMAANILNGQTAQTADLVQRLRPAPVPAFIVPNPLASTGTTTTPTA